MTAQPHTSPIEFARELKDRLALDALIGQYVPDLKPSGSSFKACCPFHKEKTPSFYVHPDPGFYKCFGCGKSGDHISFLMEHEKVDFMLALELLARHAGVELPVFRPGAGAGDDRAIAELREVCAWAEHYYVEQLGAHEGGPRAREYLRRRGLTDGEIATYRLGYAPPGYETLLQAAARRGYSGELLTRAGLASRRDDGRFVDRFRDRVMFPIHDRMGQVVAFGGRWLEEQPNTGKYINSAETAIFKKSQLVYGYAAAREGIRDAGQAILLEGYMDWIAMHRQGLTHVLAGMGTALTDDQARLISRLTRRVTLLYDGDAAGQTAMFRATQVLLRRNLDVRAAVLPEDDDPDTFLDAHGTQAMRELLEAAPAAVDYFIDREAAAAPAGDPRARSEAVAVLAPLLLAIEDPVLREGYEQRLATRLRFSVQAVRGAIRRRRPRQRPAGEAHDGAGSAENDAHEEAPSRTEMMALHLAVRLRGEWTQLQRLEPEMFEHAVARRVFERLYEAEREVREGADPVADPLELCQDAAERECLQRALLAPATLFGGEMADFDAGALREAFECQVLKLRGNMIRRRKELLTDDLGRELGRDPLGGGRLEAIDDLSRTAVNEHAAYLMRSAEQGRDRED